jgi:hypothetical protein
MDQKFPIVLYVATEGEGDEAFFVGEKDIESFEHDEKIGVYELKSVGTISVHKTLNI